ncbi:hypothetical protein [Amycolatopsis vancoresmycina]|uniref:Pilus assembly protein CpaF n=1 Tax=Amycolatopsis vancoresmycina DSM 44592 TaxID=1292037 RepID=R1IAW7_9PSEU|nr:hypothetical protein [Amycolatopsis vancoresmycina]EOD67524.1 pilus assembly protein CpaF [Amycolatopsis vancoresmycina DSM 44592]
MTTDFVDRVRNRPAGDRRQADPVAVGGLLFPTVLQPTTEGSRIAASFSTLLASPPVPGRPRAESWHPRDGLHHPDPHPGQGGDLMTTDFVDRVRNRLAGDRRQANSVAVGELLFPTVLHLTTRGSRSAPSFSTLLASSSSGSSPAEPRPASRAGRVTASAIPTRIPAKAVTS